MLCAVAACSAALAQQQPPPARSQSAQEPAENHFTDEEGNFDVSGFLSSHYGFLPVAVPITEPAVGYGLALGLSYFHSKPPVVSGAPGEPPRTIMPSTTVLMGAATENGTWAGALAHLGIWDNGNKRYVGAAGYASLELDWFGRDDAFQGQSIGYTNDTLFLYQGIKFRLEDSDFFAGPVYRLIDSDATFDTSALDPGIPAAQFDSRTSGIGAEVSYDSLDHPYGPTRGLKCDVVVTQQGEWLGGDFDYTRIRSYFIGYVPLSEVLVLGGRGNADATIGTAPFYDLASIQARGIEMFRYVDDNALYGETELRWDFLPRWTAVAFAGGGAVGGDYGDLGEAHFAGGVGGRYLIAAKYGLRMGLDVAYDGEDWTVYVALGTGWVRP